MKLGYYIRVRIKGAPVQITYRLQLLKGVLVVGLQYFPRHHLIFVKPPLLLLILHNFSYDKPIIGLGRQKLTFHLVHISINIMNLRLESGVGGLQITNTIKGWVWL